MADTEKARAEIRNVLDELATRRQKKIITTSVRSGRRADVIVVGKRGHYVRHRKPESDKIKDLAILPTISAAIMRGGQNFSITREDFREKVRRKKISTLLTIVFDGSSSMVKDDKIGSIKDILDEILLDAYQKRDRVSLVVYAGQFARTILTFSTSVESAKKYLEMLQYGGTTPLSSGILTGLELLEMKLLAEPESIPIMLVITDGSHNVPITPGADLHRELMETCAQVKDSDIKTLIIDVARGGSPLAKEIADASGARYFVVRSGHAEEERVDLVNQEVVKGALSLTLIDNQLGNILLRGATGGCVKTVLDDLDEMGMEIEVVEGCKFNCNPRKPENFCPECTEKYSQSKPPFMLQPVRILRTDSNLTVDQLKGSVDDRGNFTRGMFGRGNRGIIYIDDVDKLSVDVVSILAQTMNTGINVLETERRPIVHPARFVLVGRLSAPDARVPSSIYSHISMLVDAMRMSDIERRLRRIEQQKEFDTDSKKFRQNLKKKNKENLFRVIRARTLLSNIKTPDAQLDIIGRISVESNVGSNVLDILIERISRASAAYNSRMNVDMHDIIVASEYVLPLYTNRNASAQRSMAVIRENIEDMKGWVSRLA